MIVNSPPGERTAWIDVGKGMCIFLVVYGHVSGGLETAGALSADSGWIWLREWVYLFHMPAFFALSGLFAYKLTPLSARDFLASRLRSIGYPYLIWTFIIVAAQYAMLQFVNNPPDFSRVCRFLVEPYGYGLWFLYSLLIISTLFYFLVRLKIPISLVVLLAVVLSFLASRRFFEFWPILNQAMSFFVYYALAAYAREKIQLQFTDNDWQMPLLAGGGALVAMTALFSFVKYENWPMNLLLATLGVVGVGWLAQGLAQTAVCRFWSLLGVFSLEIYLGHPLWSTLARAVSFKSGIHIPVIVLSICVLVGVGGSLLFGVLCRRWNFPYFFRWPAKAISRQLQK